MKPQILVNLSGGVDSTYALWRLLKLGYPTTVHHVKLKSREGRVKFEQDAVTNIINWLAQQNLRPVAYVEQGYDYGNLRYVIRDIEIIRYMTGVVLQSRPHTQVNTVIASGIKHDARLSEEHVARIRRLLADASGRHINLMRPIRHLTKSQILAHMPEELFNLTWYCRKPQANGRLCHRCRTCRHVDAARDVARDLEGPALNLDIEQGPIPFIDPGLAMALDRAGEGDCDG